MKAIIKHLEGQSTSSLMAIYFRSTDGALLKPTSVVIPTCDEGWLELEADGCGRVRTSSSFFDRLFYDAKLGHSFIAPLIMAMDNAFDGSETVSKIDLTESETLTSIRFSTSDDRSFSVRFEDDNLYIDFD